MTEENKCKCTCEECGDECNPYYKRLEQENKELKEKIKKYSAINEQDTKDYVILRKVLVRIQTIINEVLTP